MIAYHIDIYQLIIYNYVQKILKERGCFVLFMFTHKKWCRIYNYCRHLFVSICYTMIWIWSILTFFAWYKL